MYYGPNDLDSYIVAPGVASARITAARARLWKPRFVADVTLATGETLEAVPVILEERRARPDLPPPAPLTYQDLLLLAAPLTAEALAREERLKAPTRPTMKLVIDVVCRFYGLKIGEMKSPRRTADLARKRHVCMYLMRHLVPSASLPMIGDALGGKDHSTVFHGVQKIEGLIDACDPIAEDVEALINIIYGLTGEPE